MTSQSEARERDVKAIIAGLNSVSTFIATTMGAKPLAPTAKDIESYCADQQRKINLLLAEAAKLRACEDEMEECSTEEAGTKVRWTDLDGNAATDAAWLK